MKKNIFAIAGVIFVILMLGFLGSYFFNRSHGDLKTNDAAVVEDNRHIMVGSEVSFLVPENFTLAIDESQLLVNSYIPPCDQDFQYCIYYIGSKYANTNFESAGIGIKVRQDLTNPSACITTSPAGYSNLNPQTRVTNQYAVGEFDNLGDAAAGHYSVGKEYRLFYDKICYEFKTRIGQSRFENYPIGSIQEFTITNQQEMQQQLDKIINSITIIGNNQPVF